MNFRFTPLLGVIGVHVLLYARPGSDKVLAGDAIQARATAAALRNMGIQADLAEGVPFPDPAPYDLVHLFNLMPVETTHAAFRAARAAGKPVALATIFWDPAEFLDVWDRDGAFAGWWARTNRLRREVLAGARVILPNSGAELDCLRRAFGADLPPHVIVPNGVDVSLFHPGLRAALPRVDVLCVGRISARKNQLGLLDGLRGTGLSVRFVGPVNDFNYYRSCRAAAWPGVEFREEMRGPRLAALYAAAGVHALVSWYETPGLASLEAAACGCRVVSTDRGCAREYLGEQAWYCPPDDPTAIRAAVQAALAAPVPTGLAQRVQSRFSWAEAAKATAAGYEKVLAAGGGSCLL